MSIVIAPLLFYWVSPGCHACASPLTFRRFTRTPCRDTASPIDSDSGTATVSVRSSMHQFHYSTHRLVFFVDPSTATGYAATLRDLLPPAPVSWLSRSPALIDLVTLRRCDVVVNHARPPVFRLALKWRQQWQEIVFRSLLNALLFVLIRLPFAFVLHQLPLTPLFLMLPWSRTCSKAV